jgi:hypothetical protein
LEGYYIALAKPRRKAMPTSFCNQIINHETKELFLRYLFHVHHIIPNIFIEVNEGITKFFTLVVEC